MTPRQVARRRRAVTSASPAPPTTRTTRPGCGRRRPGSRRTRGPARTTAACARVGDRRPRRRAPGRRRSPESTKVLVTVSGASAVPVADVALPLDDGTARRDSSTTCVTARSTKSPISSSRTRASSVEPTVALPRQVPQLDERAALLVPVVDEQLAAGPSVLERDALVRRDDASRAGSSAAAPPAARSAARSAAWYASGRRRRTDAERGRLARRSQAPMPAPSATSTVEQLALARRGAPRRRHRGPGPPSRVAGVPPSARSSAAMRCAERRQPQVDEVDAAEQPVPVGVIRLAALAGGPAPDPAACPAAWRRPQPTRAASACAGR